MKERTKNFTIIPSTDVSGKRPASPTDVGDPKKLKGILKNKLESKTPSDVSDNARIEVEKIIKEEKTDDSEKNNNEHSMQVDHPDDPLPEGFFDDPIMDAKVI